jgi:lipopolysaccharide biosynthesis protein
LLIVYYPQHLPDARRTAEIWRKYCRSIGMGDIHICAALTHGNEDYLNFGFDSGVEFPPHNLRLANINFRLGFYDAFCGNVMEYATIAQSYLERTYTAPRVFKTVFPSWDNTARVKDRALIVLNGVPENYEYWLSSTIDLTLRSGGDVKDDKIVFINAWNEWAEGCHLEPDRWFGHGFLQATLNAKSGMRRFATFPDTHLPQAADESHHRTFWIDLIDLFDYHVKLRFGNLKLAVNRRPWLRSLLLPLVRKVRTLRARRTVGGSGG